VTNFVTQFVYLAHLHWIGYQRLGSKNENDGTTGTRKKSDDIFSRHNSWKWETDGQTDRHRTTAKTALSHSVAR